MLPRPEPVQRTSMRRGRGLHCSVQQGQYDNLVGILKDGQPGHHIELQCAAVALRLPLPYAYLVAVGRWTSFLIPSVEGRMSWIANWKQLHVRLPSPVAMMFSGTSAAGLTADVVQSTADYLREHCHHQDLVNVDSEAAMEVHKLLSTLQVYVDEMQPAALKALTTSGLMSTNPELLFELYGDEAMPMLSSHRHVFKAASIIHCLQHAGMLKSDAHLHDAIKLSLYQALPSGMIPPMIEALENQCSPDKCTISRWRFIMDTAYMLVRREDATADFQRGKTYARWLMMDSSFQCSRDYELILLCSCATEDLEHAYRLVRQIKNILRDVPTEEEFAAEVTMMDLLRSFFEMHRPPPVAMGSGNTTVACKFIAVLHALFLDVGPSLGYLCFQAFVHEIKVSTTDHGVEFIVRFVHPMPVHTCLPWTLPEDADAAGGEGKMRGFDEDPPWLVSPGRVGAGLGLRLGTN